MVAGRDRLRTVDGAARDLLWVVGIALAFEGIFFAPRDGEFGWQRFLADTILRDRALPTTLGAESLTADGAPYVPHQWIFALLVRELTASGPGYVAFAALMAALAAGALAIGASTARALGGTQRGTLLAIVLACVPVASGFHLRGQMFVWPCVALLARWTLLRGTEWRLVPLAAGWANLHGSAVLVPVVAGLAAAGACIDERAVGTETRRLGLVAASCAVAVCATPFGVRLWSAAIGLEFGPLRDYISEWHAPQIGSPVVLVLVAMALALAVSRASVRSARACLPALFFFAAAASAGRYLAIAAIALLPHVGLALTPLVRGRARDVRRSPERPSGPPSERRVVPRATPPVAGAASVAAVVGLALFAHPDRWFAAPSDIVSVRTLPGERRIFCQEFATCSFALGQPRERVFLDGRADPYPAEIWRLWKAVDDARPGWEDVISRYRVNTILTTRGEPLDASLERMPAWARSYARGRNSVWIPSSEARVPSPRFRLSARPYERS